MKRILLALFALAAIASAACRQYDVDVYRNVNGKVPQGENYGVSQSFVCTSDSMLWADVFIGVANLGGKYHIEIQTPDQQRLYYGDANAGDSVHHQHERAALTRDQTHPELIKGETYDLKVWLQSPYPNETLNYYYSDQDPYPHGMMSIPGNTQPLWWDLCARIEG